jgi:hypothetical protein
MSICFGANAGEGEGKIHIFFLKNDLPLKVYVNDTLIALMKREDLVLNVTEPGRYVLEFKNENIDDRRVIDIKSDEVIYYRLRSAYGSFFEITAEEAARLMDDKRQRIVIEGQDLPRGLPLPQ